jgi:surface protein
MGIIVNNIKPIRIIFNGVEATLYHNGIKIWPEGSDPYNPLNLPPNTVRVRTNDGNVPFKTNNTSYETATLVPGTTDVYDVYKSGTDFSRLLQESSNVIEVIGANTSNITDASRMFSGCSNLTTVPLFDTSNVTNMFAMFSGCSNLTTVPLFDTSKATSMRNMFQNCTRVQSGALALYQQASSQANPPSNHSMTFYKCGSNTTTGAAELAQIPADWK